jgi:hypothetical protein
MRLEDGRALLFVVFALVTGKSASFNHRTIVLELATMLATTSCRVASEVVHKTSRVFNLTLDFDVGCPATEEVTDLSQLLFRFAVYVGPVVWPVVHVFDVIAHISVRLEAQLDDAFHHGFCLHFPLRLALALLLCSLGGFGFLKLCSLELGFFGRIVIPGLVSINVGGGFRSIDILSQFVRGLVM